MHPTSIGSVPSRVLLLLAILGVALAAIVLVGRPQPAEGQAPGCAENPQDGITPRCLVIVKQTTPDNSPDDFDFDVTVDPPAAGPSNDSETLGDGESFGIALGAQGTPAGTVITVVEDVPDGWDLSVSCTGDGITASNVAGGVQITYTGDLGANEPFAYGVCTFRNEKESTPTATPTVTGTVTTTPTATTTVTPTATPTSPFGANLDRPNVGGIFIPAPARTSTPVRQAAVPTPVTASPRPPSTGDGGLR
jgi:hypothetical protein